MFLAGEYSIRLFSERLCRVVVNYFIVFETASSLGIQGASAGLGGSLVTGGNLERYLPVVNW